MQLQQSSEAAESKLQATSKIMLLRGQKEHQLFIQNKEPSIWALPKISKFFVHIDCESVCDVVEDGSMYQLAPNARVDHHFIIVTDHVICSKISQAID